MFNPNDLHMRPMFSVSTIKFPILLKKASDYRTYQTQKLSNICFIQVPNTIKKLKSDNKGQFEAAQKKRYPALGALGV